MSTTEELAKQAGVDIMQHEWEWSYKWPASLEALERFRALAVAAERERCAKLCQEAAERYLHGNFGEAAGACTHLASLISGER